MFVLKDWKFVTFTSFGFLFLFFFLATKQSIKEDQYSALQKHIMEKVNGCLQKAKAKKHIKSTKKTAIHKIFCELLYDN